MKPIMHVGSLVEKGTLSSLGALSTNPVTRLADGDIGLLWIDSATTPDRTVSLDLGSGVVGAAKAWALPTTHNLGGVTVVLESAATLAGPWTDQGSAVPVAGTALRVALPAVVSARCWRLRFSNPATPPQLGEWSLTNPLVLPSGPQEPNLVTGPSGNVVSIDSTGGYTWTRKRGPSRWEADYMIRDLKDDERASLEAAFAACDEGARPFFLEDHNGELRWVYWMVDSGKLAFQAEGRTRWRALLRFRQAL